MPLINANIKFDKVLLTLARSRRCRVTPASFVRTTCICKISILCKVIIHDNLYVIFKLLTFVMDLEVTDSNIGSFLFDMSMIGSMIQVRAILKKLVVNRKWVLYLFFFFMKKESPEVNPQKTNFLDFWRSLECRRCIYRQIYFHLAVIGTRVAGMCTYAGQYVKL